MKIILFSSFILEKLLYITKYMTLFVLFSGDIIIFEIFTVSTAITQIKMTDISQFCLNPLNKIKYKLIGVVAYKKPMVTRNIQIGHYTTICPRAGTWVEYNDLDKNERYVKNNAKITPALLIYAKDN